MFFIGLEDEQLELLFKLAKEMGITPKRLASLALERGLTALATEEKEVSSVVASADALTETDAKQKANSEALEYIPKNWESMSDAEMGAALGYSSASIRLFRFSLGLYRKRGGNRSADYATRVAVMQDLDKLIRKHYRKKSDEEIGMLLTPPVRGHIVSTRRSILGLKKAGPGSHKYKRLDTLIRKHYLAKNDGEIGLMMKPAVSRSTVFGRRLALNLLRPRGQKSNTVREAVIPEEFERMVLREGYTMTEYLTYKGLRCGRERLRQVAVEMGLKHSPADRTREWEMHRLARRLGREELLNKEWLHDKLQSSDSVASLSGELKIESNFLFFFIRRHGLTHPQFRKHNVETVKLTCTKCNAEFERVKRWVDARMRKADGKPVEFFCGLECTGKFNAERKARRESEKAAEHS